MRRNTENDFWKFVDKRGLNECWEWQGNRLVKEHYGRFYLSGSVVRAHRFAYQITYGDIPNGLSVLHKCDNPPCCNPNHLFLGSDYDNVHDALRKGRRTKETSVNNGRTRAKLTRNDVKHMRAMLSNGFTKQEIANMFDISRSTIRRVQNNEAWADVS